MSTPYTVILINRAAAKSQKGPRKGTYPYRRYNKTQPTFLGTLLCPLYEKIDCGENKIGMTHVLRYISMATGKNQKHH